MNLNLLLFSWKTALSAPGLCLYGGLFLGEYWHSGNLSASSFTFRLVFVSPPCVCSWTGRRREVLGWRGIDQKSSAYTTCSHFIVGFAAYAHLLLFWVVCIFWPPSFVPCVRRRPSFWWERSRINGKVSTSINRLYCYYSSIPSFWVILIIF